MNKNKKILIVRLGAIGDVVHSSALFRSIKKKYPDSIIHYATTKVPSLLIENDPDLDKVWVLDSSKIKSYRYLYEFSKELRKENYDICINLQPSLRIKFFCFCTVAKKHITYKKSFKFHAVENFWRTGLSAFKDLELDKNLQIYLDEAVKNTINEKIANLKKPLVIMNVALSTTRQGRLWPPEYWIELTNSLVEKYDCQVVLTGAKEDIPSTQPLLGLKNVISFCGELSIAETAALMSFSNLVISGDTGPLHIATAVGVNTIGIYGAAPISRTGPYGDKANAICSDFKCMACNRRKCKFLKKNELYTPCLVELKPKYILNMIDTKNLI